MVTTDKSIWSSDISIYLSVTETNMKAVDLMCQCGGQMYHRRRSVLSGAPGTESSLLWALWVHEAPWSDAERPAPPSAYGLPKPAWSTPVSCRTPSPDWEVIQQKEEEHRGCGRILPSLPFQVCPLWSLYRWQWGKHFNILEASERWSFMQSTVTVQH